ncbi:MAG: ATP-binding cassette domain-containing protein [Planctomycetota bacterium]
MSFAAAIQCRGLTVEAAGRPILGPLDLAVAPGEHVLVVGPSGSGKTTLLRAIAGLALPERGELELFGEPASGKGSLALAPEHRGVAMLFQGAALWPHLSVERTLRFVLARKGVKGGAARARVAELLSSVELVGFERRLPGTLSGGERQRLALARALASRPRIMLLDEPLGPLDAELRASLLARIDSLHHQESWTTLHVTHDPEAARSIATRVLRLERGSLVNDGRADRAGARA